MPARSRRTVAAATALVVALTGCVAMLAAPAQAVVAGAATGVALAAPAASLHPSLERTRPRERTPQERAERRRAHRLAERRARHRAEQAAERRAEHRAEHRARARAWRATWKAMSPAERRAATRRAQAERRAERRAELRRAAQHRREVARREARRRAEAARERKRARYMARWAKVRPLHPETWLQWAPGSAAPASGPLFNNPYGNRPQRRRLLQHVIAAIDASPGYRLRRPGGTGRQLTCPTDPADAPSEIKIAVYSIADQAFADAIVAAHRRCVSVQVLMNSHLTSVTSPSWGRIIDELGARGSGWEDKASFAHRCSDGCLGSSVLHSKFYLFSRAGTARDTIMVGSSNMTRNAVKVQWNDLYTVNRHPTMYRQYRSMFEQMVPDDQLADGPFVFRPTGRYQSTFYPFRDADRNTDSTVQALRTVRCTGAADGAGFRGRTVVYVAMHAWFGQRGQAVTRQLRGLYRRGCYVRVLYSFVMRKTVRELTRGTGSRMVVRRVLYPGPYGVLAAKYSHLKMFAISGRVLDDPSAHVVYTGSNNWTDRSNRADEVTLRIDSAAAYRAYVRQWRHIRATRSTPVWAMFEEPVGGGRAPTP